jgi:hypothetical protein
MSHIPEVFNPIPYCRENMSQTDTDRRTVSLLLAVASCIILLKIIDAVVSFILMTFHTVNEYFRPVVIISLDVYFEGGT